MNCLERFYSSFEKSDFCWEWKKSLAKTGYGQFWMNGKNISSHRASWILHKGEIPSGLWICHHCDNKKCVNPDHLFLGTVQDNVDDAISKGLFSKQKSKINDEKISDVIKLYSEGMTHKEIGKLFGSSPSPVFKITEKYFKKFERGAKAHLSPFAKLDKEDRNLIRKLFGKPLKGRPLGAHRLGKFFGVDKKTIYRILGEK